MKRKWTGIRVVLSICAAIGWWGALYPELTMTPDTYAVVWEDDAVQRIENMVEWDSDSDVYRAVLEADGSRIRLKSKLFTQIDALIKQLK